MRVKQIITKENKEIFFIDYVEVTVLYKLKK